MLVDAIDTYFKYVKARIITKNSQRIVKGIIEANAWPPQDVDNEAFYLLLLGETSNNEFGTVSSRGIIHLVQWTWVVIGTDLPQSNQVGKNRGNRYRNNLAMKQEIINGFFPGFCPKNSYTPQQQGNTFVAVPTAKGDNIWWSAPKFLPTRFEKQSGVIYGAAQAFICEFDDLITS